MKNCEKKGVKRSRSEDLVGELGRTRMLGCDNQDEDSRLHPRMFKFSPVDCLAEIVEERVDEQRTSLKGKQW